MIYEREPDPDAAEAAVRSPLCIVNIRLNAVYEKLRS
jgi:hypothetical protein